MIAKLYRYMILHDILRFWRANIFLERGFAGFWAKSLNLFAGRNSQDKGYNPEHLSKMKRHIILSTSIFGVLCLFSGFVRFQTPGVSTDMIPWFHLQHQPVISHNFTIFHASQRYGGGLPAIMMTLWTSLGRPTPSSMPLVRRPEMSHGKPGKFEGDQRWWRMLRMFVLKGMQRWDFGGWKDSHGENEE